MVGSTTFNPGTNSDKINAVLIEEFDILPNVSENTAAFSSEDFRKLFNYSNTEEKVVQIGDKVFKAKEIECLRKGHVGVTFNAHKEFKDKNLIFTKYLAVPVHPASLNTQGSNSNPAHSVSAAPLPQTQDKLPKLDHSKLSFREFLNQSGWIGLPEELEDTLNPIFAAYGTLKEAIKYRGIKVEKGILLSGPPGTGKTSFARKLAEYLNCQPEHLRILSATEVLNHRVGGTEELIRELFEPAKKAMKTLGEKSPLFMIIIDEFDSISTSRFKAEHAWERTQVNEFLSCMDGLVELNNLLVIAMTNNPELIDPAFVRPGRFGTKIEIGYPLNDQRRQLFESYLKPLKEKGLISLDVDIEELVKMTAGFTGADIHGLIDKVQNNVMAKLQKLHNAGQIQLDTLIKHPLQRLDFMEALRTFVSTQQRLLSVDTPSRAKVDFPIVSMSKL